MIGDESDELSLRSMQLPSEAAAHSHALFSSTQSTASSVHSFTSDGLSETSTRRRRFDGRVRALSKAEQYLLEQLKDVLPSTASYCSFQYPIHARVRLQKDLFVDSLRCGLLIGFADVLGSFAVHPLLSCNRCLC